MKQHSVTASCCCLAVLIGAFIIANPATAQTKTHLVLNNSKLLNATVPSSELKPVVNGESGRLNAIHVKAMRDFKKKYPDIEGEQWFLIPNGFMATFAVDSVKNRILYDSRGDWTYSVLYYSEKKLPKDVRAQVKSTYYDYAITGIDEVQVPGKTIYIVHLEDQSTWKKLRICDGEMEIIEDFNKK